MVEGGVGERAHLREDDDEVIDAGQQQQANGGVEDQLHPRQHLNHQRLARRSLLRGQCRIQDQVQEGQRADANDGGSDVEPAGDDVEPEEKIHGYQALSVRRWASRSGPQRPTPNAKRLL